MWKLDIGANPVGDGRWSFRVWAPLAREVELLLLDGKKESRFRMEGERGYFSVVAPAKDGMNYAFILDRKKRRADPASRYQPDGVHGDSQLIDPSSYHWSDGTWKGIALSDYMIYELHVGTFTKDGTFESIIHALDYLAKDLGVTAIEIMPVAQFAGTRNWGYDGVLMYAVQNSYGGPLGLKKLVDACHAANLAVVMDVVYNHVGPEGNRYSDFGQYFSDRYHTPWGPAINYDEGGSDEVRRYVIENANYWINEYHCDALRLDAIHGIYDFSARHILEEMKDSIEKNKAAYLIAESDLDDPKIILPKDHCGYGIDAQWSDDFHHAVQAYLTGEKYGYYSDFGEISDIEKSIRDGFVYDGRFSKFRNRRHGASSAGLPGDKFVVFVQNHDQVGNRADGKRLYSLVDVQRLKLAAGLLILSPAIPLLFMGEEYGENAPFYFFTSHTDPLIASATSEGRKTEFQAHNFQMPFVDPQDEETFLKSKIHPELRSRSPHREIFQCYKELISLRKNHPAFRELAKDVMTLSLDNDQKILSMRRRGGGEELATFFVLGSASVEADVSPAWRMIYSSGEVNGNRLSAMSVTVYKT